MILGQDKPPLDSDTLAHYGVKGMKWGVRKDRGGAPRATVRRAKKDADEFAKAKMFYGEGAGTRRKLIKAQVEARSKNDPAYKQAFDEALSNQNMAKRANQAHGARKRADAKKSVKKTSKGIGHVLRGNSQYANTAAVVAVGAGALWYNNGGNRVIANYARQSAGSPAAKAAVSLGQAYLRGKGFG